MRTPPPRLTRPFIREVAVIDRAVYFFALGQQVPPSGLQQPPSRRSGTVPSSSGLIIPFSRRCSIAFQVTSRDSTRTTRCSFVSDCVGNSPGLLSGVDTVALLLEFGLTE